MVPLVGALDADSGIAGIYLVGGGSSLPLVGRMMRERFGRRVHRSPYPAASTAIGLALAADPDSGFTLVDRLSRGIGVFRESQGGRAVRTLDDGWTVVTADGRLSAQFEHTVAVTKGGARVLTLRPEEASRARQDGPGQFAA